MHFLDFVLKVFCVAFCSCSNSSAMGSSVKDDVYDFLFKGQYSACCIDWRQMYKLCILLDQCIYWDIDNVLFCKRNSGLKQVWLRPKS